VSAYEDDWASWVTRKGGPFQPASAPVVLLSDSEDPDQVLDALNKGLRGCIPATVSADVAIEAISLVAAGGLYIPASAILTRNANERPAHSVDAHAETLFTERQAEVVEAVRMGKANKIIAYELNMRESTVKVHIRNIMRKLRARNRTEVAYLVNSVKVEATKQI
jgi:DNA-binding NarL/FixJ family response regulator